MSDDLQIYRKKYSKGHLVIDGIFLLFTIIQWISNASVIEHWIIVLAILLVSLDILAEFTPLSKCKVTWYILRGIQLVLLSIAYLTIVSVATTIFIAICLACVMFEILLASDFTDVYTRSLIISMMTFPGIIFLIIMLLIKQGDQSEVFGMICSYIGIVIYVLVLSNLMSEVLVTSDKRIFELRRLSESTKEANKALRIQQEKVKRANEELGVQKIKLESAYNRINTANAETTIQNLILKYISSSLEIGVLMDLITESILEAMGLDVCAVVIQPNIAGNEKIRYQIRTRVEDDFLELMSSKIEQGYLEKYMKAEGNHVDNRVIQGNYVFLKGQTIKSLLMVPLIRDNAVIGSLVCGHSHYDFFHENIMFFETVVTQLNVAIYNASLYSKMQQMAIRDSLTGIYNRGQLNLKMDEYSREAKEMGWPLSVALFDIDHFKEINDTYGHLFGDVVIKHVAARAMETANRHNGMAARYGGEEFVVVFQNKTIKECNKIVEELKNQIDHMNLECEEEKVTVKVSVGITCYPETCVHITELLNRADGAMYYSKKTGRDRITIDSDMVFEYVGKSNE